MNHGSAVSRPADFGCFVEGTCAKRLGGTSQLQRLHRRPSWPSIFLGNGRAGEASRLSSPGPNQESHTVGNHRDMAYPLLVFAGIAGNPISIPVYLLRFPAALFPGPNR